jgi:rubrerythrin
MSRAEAYDGLVAWEECPNCGFRAFATDAPRVCPRCDTDPLPTAE